jgi:hypothetical protein
LALPGREAAAQEKDAVTDMARRRFQEGVKFFDQKKYEEARAAFLQAYALKHHPAVLLNLAHSEIRSGHNLEAARHFATYLRDPPVNATQSEKAEAERALATARSKLGRIQVTAPTGADILVDGESMGQSPLPEAVDASPGNHTVEARLGGKTASTNVAVSVGRSASATLSLEGSAAPLPPPTPSPTPPPSTAPSTETPEPTPPPADTTKPPPPNETDVTVSTAGREPFFSWLGHSPLGIIGVGATGIGLGMFIGFGVGASKASDNADSVANAITNQIADDNRAIDKQNQSLPANQRLPHVDANRGVCAPPAVAKYDKACSVLQDDMDKRDADRNLATIGIAVAGVGVATTVLGYFLTSRPSSKTASSSHEPKAQAPSATLIPVIGPQENGLQLVGRF